MQVHLLVVDPLAIDEVLVLARRVVLVVNLVVSSDIFSSTIFLQILLCSAFYLALANSNM